MEAEENTTKTNTEVVVGEGEVEGTAVGTAVGAGAEVGLKDNSNPIPMVIMGEEVIKI